MAGVSLIFVVLFFYFSFRKELKASEKHDEAVTYPSPQEAITDRKRFAVSVVIFAAAIVMLVTHAQTGLTDTADWRIYRCFFAAGIRR